MNFAERTPITVSLIGVVYYAIFLLISRNALRAGKLEGAEGLVYTAKSMLAFIVLFVITVIGAFILQAIIEAIRTGKDDVDDVEDERDRAFEFYSLKIQSLATGLGFLGALIVLAFGYSAPLALHIIFFGNMAGLVTGEMRKHALYLGV